MREQPVKGPAAWNRRLQGFQVPRGLIELERNLSGAAVPVEAEVVPDRLESRESHCDARWPSGCIRHRSPEQ